MASQNTRLHQQTGVCVELSYNFSLLFAVLCAQYPRPLHPKIGEIKVSP
jgi:hypothetical protein